MMTDLIVPDAFRCTCGHWIDVPVRPTMESQVKPQVGQTVIRECNRCRRIYDVTPVPRQKSSDSIQP